MSEIREETQNLPPVSRTPARSGGGGCWIPALITAFVVFVLVIVGLFLPPVDLWNRLFGTQYAVLSADANAIAADGLTLVVDPANPGRDFGVGLDSIPVATFLNGGTNQSWATTALAAAPAYLALQSPVYTIETTGQAPDEVSLDITIPPTAGDPDVLSIYAWDAADNEWHFVPSSRSSDNLITARTETVPQHLALFQVAPPQQPTVLVSVDVVQTLSSDVAELATIVAPAGLQPTVQGTLTGSLAAGFDMNASYVVMPVLRNYV
ncbi:MAG: hypothetical protein K8L99_00205, partial [Anaerolineae bacterium]|nr:hypothetical protein [Anaerolineae bacterium]